MRQKKQLSAEQVYKRNQKRAKILRVLSPIIFWSFLGLGILCFVLALKNSFGNIAEIIRLLDNKVFTGEQLQANYTFLLGKYGEWDIGNGGSGFAIKFVDIRKAVFSGFMLTNAIMCVFFVASAYILGKWLLPKLAQQIDKDNQDMVNLTVLRNN